MKTGVNHTSLFVVVFPGLLVALFVLVSGVSWLIFAFVLGLICLIVFNKNISSVEKVSTNLNSLFIV